MKIFKRILLGLFILILGFVVYNMQSSFRTSRKGIDKYFAKRGCLVRQKSIPHGNDSLFWVETGPENPAPGLPVILFVHGAPGSANNFFPYQADADLQKKAILVSMDRPGYGYSNYGRSEVSIEKQAKAVKAVMDQYPGRRFILVGHSYGGPIIAKAAYLYPDSIRSILMLAPVNHPDHEPMFWVSYWAKWPATRWTVSRAYRVSADEKFSHAAELGKMREDWSLLKVPVTHLHGTKDMLAPMPNIDFSRQEIPKSQLNMVVMEGTGHLIPFTLPEVTKKYLLAALSEP
jgi:pimeloyl-ACP methyl ester carboxylesterase